MKKKMVRKEKIRGDSREQAENNLPALRINTNENC